MTRLMKIGLLVAVMAAVVYGAGRLGHAAPATDVTVTDIHAEHMMTMTPEEHVKMMAAGGNIHANHALDEFARLAPHRAQTRRARGSRGCCRRPPSS